MLSLVLSLSILIGADNVNALVIALDPMSCGVSISADGERLDRLRRWSPGDPMCMYISVDNAYDYAHRVLWAHSGGVYGADVSCIGNLTADEVPCLIDITNRNFHRIRQVWVSCTTLRHCGHYGQDKGLCCHQ